MQNLHNIYTFWQNNPKLWFNSSDEDDKYISENFMTFYMQSIMQSITQSINDMSIDDMYKEDWTSYCILNDQLIKHFNRHYGINLSAPYNFIINCYNKYNYLKHHQLNDFEFMFCLMPLRHTHQLINVKFVLEETWKRLSNDKTNQFIRKFLIATYERYIKLTKEYNLIQYNNYEIDNNFNHPEILDNISPKDFSIMITFNDNDPLYNCMEEFIKNNNLINEEITVSISGGVDSMICSYLLKQLTYKFKNLKISCVHIDYNNRAECKYEEELLIWWCNNILNIPLYIRRIDEINRPKCMEYELRDLYESYTKDVRFNSYINYSTNNSNVSYVVLGHNKDDTIENIFTNTASCSHYDNLLGMTNISHQTYKNKQICFLRPLINIPKSDIYEYAIKHNIPFLQDSTPKWSQRGKIRDIVKPALNEWNPLIFDGLINLSDKMSQMTLLLDKLISPDINNTKYNSINDVPLDIMYWTIVFRKNNIFPTQKTLTNLINRIKHYQLFPHKLNDAQKIQLCKDKMLILKQQKDKLSIYL
jgi:tRNA(Ile)-lysidine synthetase-like protein